MTGEKIGHVPCGNSNMPLAEGGMHLQMSRGYHLLPAVATANNLVTLSRLMSSMVWITTLHLSDLQ